MAQGHIIYQNSSLKAIDYFASIGYKCSESMNPADFFMNIISIESLEDTDTDDKEELKK